MMVQMFYAWLLLQCDMLLAQEKIVPVFIENPQASAPGDNQTSTGHIFMTNIHRSHFYDQSVKNHDSKECTYCDSHTFHLTV